MFGGTALVSEFKTEQILLNTYGLGCFGWTEASEISQGTVI